MLIPLDEALEPLPVESSSAGWAYRTLSPQVDGAEFGLDRFTDFIIRSTAAGQCPAEVLRLLIHAVLDHQRNQLRDATILLFEWRPRHR